MNENIDLTKILKDCQKGWKLYSTLYGEVEFEKIKKESEYPIVIITKHGNNSSIKSDGRYYGEYDDGECTLFPSKDQRDWSKFKTPWYNPENQDEDKKEINNFDVLPGLYKCVHRMFDGTPDGRLLFEIGNVYKCVSKHDRAEFEVSYGHSVYLEDPVVCKYFIPFESKVKQDSSQTNERAWLYLVSDVLTWQDGIGQYLDDPRVQELAKRLCKEYEQKLYNPSNTINTVKNEQKSADKVEPKFHKGDWITIDKPCQIININDKGNYIVKYCDDEKTHELSKNFCESYFHLWTIQDAKDGDVLCYKSGWVCIFKSLNNHTNTFSSYYFMDSDKCFFNSGSECHALDKEFINAYNGEIHPVTKEQRDLLFQKIKEVDYNWVAETKTLEKLVEPKFDPKTLQPFDNVLVRDSYDDTWKCSLFSHIIKHEKFQYMCVGHAFVYCIPYNEDTKHLVGTNDEAPEYYRYWED